MSKKKAETTPIGAKKSICKLERGCWLCKKVYEASYDSDPRTNIVDMDTAEKLLTAKIEACDHSGSDYEKTRAESSKTSATFTLVLDQVKAGDSLMVGDVYLEIVRKTEKVIEIKALQIPDFSSKIADLTA